MSAREEMLDRIRAAVLSGAGSGTPEPVPREYATSGDLTRGSAGAVELLVGRLVDYRATVHRCGVDEIPDIVRKALGNARSVVAPIGLPSEFLSRAMDLDVRIDGDPALTAEQLDGIDAVVTAATIACAVTGTVVLDGSVDQGRRIISLVPDRHVIVLNISQVVQTWPETVRELEPTRPLTMISGPSATSDIELSRVEGVHGPRDLHVVIVG